LLSRWGKIEKIELVYDEHTRKHKGYGFIKYKEMSIAELALSESGMYNLNGRRINFSIVREKEK